MWAQKMQPSDNQSNMSQNEIDTVFQQVFRGNYKGPNRVVTTARSRLPKDRLEPFHYQGPVSAFKQIEAQGSLELRCTSTISPLAGKSSRYGLWCFLIWLQFSASHAITKSMASEKSEWQAAGWASRMIRGLDVGSVDRPRPQGKAKSTDSRANQTSAYRRRKWQLVKAH